jgi:hypothetical protein
MTCATTKNKEEILRIAREPHIGFITPAGCGSTFFPCPAPLSFSPLSPSLIFLTSEREDLGSIAFDLEANHAKVLLCSQSVLLSASIEVGENCLILVLTISISVPTHPFASPLQLSTSSLKFVLQVTRLFTLLSCFPCLYLA